MLLRIHIFALSQLELVYIGIQSQDKKFFRLICWIFGVVHHWSGLAAYLLHGNDLETSHVWVGVKRGA